VLVLSGRRAKKPIHDGSQKNELEIVSGKVKSGAVVPKGIILESVSAIINPQKSVIISTKQAVCGLLL
jgi:hypothetical protein